MLSISKWACTAAAIALFVGQASAANTTAAGTIKSIDADKKTFVITDSADKDFTMTVGEAVVVNRGGKESKAGLKVGDSVFVCYDKGTLTWTANYILVREGDTKNCELVFGAVKGYDADAKELTITDTEGKSRTYAMGDAKVRLSMEDTKIGEIKIGDHALVIVDTTGGKTALKCLMASRK